MKRLTLYLLLAITMIGCNDDFLDDFENEDQNQLAKFIIPELPELPIRITEDFIWGINGHPLTSYPDYTNKTIDEQILLLKEHQFSYYRIDVETYANGQVSKNLAK